MQQVQFQFQHRGWWSGNQRSGVSLVEVVVVSGIFVLLVSGVLGFLQYTNQALITVALRDRAAVLAEGSLEIVRNMSDADFDNITVGVHGLALSGSNWVFSGANDQVDEFDRVVTVTTIDADTKQVQVDISAQSHDIDTMVTLTTNVTNWRAVSSSPDTCSLFCQASGYIDGICRQNSNRCRVEGEIHEPLGDVLCVAGPNADTCCCQ